MHKLSSEEEIENLSIVKTDEKEITLAALIN